MQTRKRDRRNTPETTPRPAEGRRPRGRPPELSAAARETAILDATERLLVEQGLHGASMAAIAAAAGMSKRTVYVVFESRAALFEACIRRIRTNFIRVLEPDERDLPLRERLARLFVPPAADRDPKMPLAVLRAVIVEAPRHPDLGQAFLREGPHRGRAIVRDELARAVARGELAIDDPGLAARLLCDMVFECPIDRLIDPDQPAWTPADAERRLALAVTTFLDGLARPAAGSG